MFLRTFHVWRLHAERTLYCSSSSLGCINVFHLQVLTSKWEPTTAEAITRGRTDKLLLSIAIAIAIARATATATTTTTTTITNSKINAAEDKTKK